MLIFFIVFCQTGMKRPVLTFSWNIAKESIDSLNGSKPLDNKLRFIYELTEPRFPRFNLNIYSTGLIILTE